MSDEEKPDNITEEKPENITEEKPENITEDKPENITEEKPENITEEKPENIIEEKSENITEENLENNAEEIRVEVTQAEEDAPIEVVEDVSEDEVDDNPVEELYIQLSPSAATAELNCGVRRRRSMGDRSHTPDLPLNLQVGYRVSEGDPDRGTPSPCALRFIPSTRECTSGASTSLAEFRNKQQSFEVHIEDCDEEEIAIESDGEGGEADLPLPNRPITPVPEQDYGCVTYTEGPQPLDYLQVRAVYNDCLTDVSDAESDNDD